VQFIALRNRHRHGSHREVGDRPSDFVLRDQAIVAGGNEGRLGQSLDPLALVIGEDGHCWADLDRVPQRRHPPDELRVQRRLGRIETGMQPIEARRGEGDPHRSEHGDEPD
jgi:hypothetical protein